VLFPDAPDGPDQYRREEQHPDWASESAQASELLFGGAPAPEPCYASLTSEWRKLRDRERWRLLTEAWTAHKADPRERQVARCVRG
jgi:hypothetical protein